MFTLKFRVSSLLNVSYCSHISTPKLALSLFSATLKGFPNMGPGHAFMGF